MCNSITHNNTKFLRMDTCSLMYTCSHEYSFLSMDICWHIGMCWICMWKYWAQSCVRTSACVYMPKFQTQSLLVYMFMFTQGQALNIVLCQPKYAYSHTCSLEHSHNLLFVSKHGLVSAYMHIFTRILFAKNKHMLAYMHIFTHIKFPGTDNTITIQMFPCM